mgnify:CR=1 FL=1
MSEPLRGVVVCHGALAQALVSAVEQITGLTGRFVPVSNTDCDRDGLERRIADAIGGAPAVVFVPDVGALLPYVVRIWMYITPVMYAVSEIPGSVQPLLSLQSAFTRQLTHTSPVSSQACGAQ